MKALSWITFILGLWMIVVGFAFSADVRPVMAESVVMGIIIAGLSLIAVARPLSLVSWLIGLAGLWTLFAPSFINYAGSHAARGNAIVIGIIVLILGAVRAVNSELPVRTH